MNADNHDKVGPEDNELSTKNEIKITKTNGLTSKQKSYAKIFYWAAYLGDSTLVRTFLSKIGLNPFAKYYMGQNLVTACIQGDQYDLLRSLIEKSDLGFDSSSKYFIPKKNGCCGKRPQKQKMFEFEKSKKNKDLCGNNVLHHAYAIQDPIQREKFVSLLLDNDFGCPLNRNKQGYMPVQLCHHHDLNLIPERHSFKMLEPFIEQFEGEYMIIVNKYVGKKGSSSRDKPDIITAQLEQLGLQRDRDFCVFHKTVAGNDHMNRVIINLRIPQKMKDQAAEELGLEGTLTYLEMDTVIKCKFMGDFGEHYNSFESTNKIAIIQHILRKEIDFEMYEFNGVIEDHFPLHTMDSTKEIQHSVDKYITKLTRSFFTGRFSKYIQPINFLKLYYGEKAALQFAFLIHYQAWLRIPSVISIALFAYQVYCGVTVGSFSAFVESGFNGLFGLFVALGSSLFLESWKRKE
jgi:hypothetical protein